VVSDGGGNLRQPGRSGVAGSPLRAGRRAGGGGGLYDAAGQYGTVPAAGRGAGLFQKFVHRPEGKLHVV